MTGFNFDRLYEFRHRAVDQGDRVAVWREIAADIWRRMLRPNIVLDPAAGRHEFINAVPAPERWAVDRFDYATEGDTSVKRLIGDIVDVELPTGYFDGVFVSNFLEHLPSQQEIACVLAKLRRSMTRDGRIAIMGPNFKYCARDYFDCADHVVPLTHVSVEEHLHAAGFQVQRVIPRYLPFSFRGRLPPSGALTRAYLACPPLWRLVGRQFLLIGSPDTGSGVREDRRRLS